MMSEVKFLHPSKPRKPPKPRSLDVIFLIEKEVRVERHRTGTDLNHEEINRQHEISTCADQTYGNEEKWRIIAFHIGKRWYDMLALLAKREITFL